MRVTCMSFRPQHRTKMHGTNPLERLNGEIKRRIGVDGVSSKEDAVTRLVGALLLERIDKLAVQPGRHMTLQNMTHLNDDTAVALPSMTA